MSLKMSKNLEDMLKKKKELSLNKDNESKLIINMGKNSKDIDDLAYIKSYVKEHTSNVRQDYYLYESGMTFVTFPKFIEMLNDGYNIYESVVIAKDYINIKYQKEIKKGIGGR